MDFEALGFLCDFAAECRQERASAGREGATGLRYEADLPARRGVLERTKGDASPRMEIVDARQQREAVTVTDDRQQRDDIGDVGGLISHQLFELGRGRQA